MYNTMYTPSEGDEVDKMIRKQVYIEPRQEILIKRLVRETGATEAEIIRQALDFRLASPLSPRRNLNAWQEERAFIDRLIQKGPVAGERRWRREELYER